VTLRLALASLLLLAAACTTAPGATVQPETPGVPASSGFSPRPLDRDHDGIQDVHDSCPDEPEDCDGFEDDDGCPDLDDDGDGFADLCDACPRVYGGPPNGCPDHRVRLMPETIRITEYLHFDRNSDAVRKESVPIIDAIADVMKTHPEIELVEAVGHASQDEPGGQALSERRARRTRDALLARGVEAARLVSRGAGSSQPIESNSTETGRARNRRVEWMVLRPTEPPPVPPRPIPTSSPQPAGPLICPASPPPPPPGGCPRVVSGP
jgi:outer membrane protein OmpA-like peptidoglycan-associated protein